MGDQEWLAKTHIEEAVRIMQRMDPWERKRILDWMRTMWPDFFPPAQPAVAFVASDHDHLFDEDATLDALQKMERIEQRNRQMIREGLLSPVQSEIYLFRVLGTNLVGVVQWNDDPSLHGEWKRSDPTSPWEYSWTCGERVAPQDLARRLEHYWFKHCKKTEE